MRFLAQHRDLVPTFVVLCLCLAELHFGWHV
jgi:hypothetical protein